MQLLEWFNQTSEFATDGIIVFEDGPQRTVFCNDAFCEQSGYARNEVIGQPPHLFLGSSSDEGTKPLIAGTPTAKQRVFKRLQNFRKDGRPYLVNLALQRVACVSERKQYWIGLQNDLSRTESNEHRLAMAQTEAGLFEKRLWDAIEALPDAFVMYDKNDRLIACNDKYREFYAASADAIFPGAHFQDIVLCGIKNGQYPEAVGREEEWLDEWRARHRKPAQPIERQLSDDRFIVLHDVITDNGDLVGLRTDVTELHKQKKQLEEQMKFVELLLNRNPAIVMSQTRNWAIQTCSDAWTQQFGYSREETVGRDLTDFMPTEDAKVSKTFRESDLLGSSGPPIVKNVLTLLTKQGERRSVELQSIIENEDGDWRNIIAMTDISPIVRARDELQRLVENDELTGLKSRRGLRRRFTDGERKTDYGFFLIDLDYFKSVNDGYGHEAGDRLLQAVADSLVDITETVGCPFRLGGEEFAVVRPWDGWAEAALFAEELRRKLEQASVLFQGKLIQRTASIGYIEVKENDELSTAMHLADLAQREAKSSGRNKSLPADAEMLRSLERRGAFIGIDHIQAALDAGEFYYDVQPIVHAGNDRIAGFEALIRWQKPNGDIVMPDMFIEPLHEVVRQPFFGKLKNELRVDVVKSLAQFKGRYVGFNFVLEEIAHPGAAEKIYKAFCGTIEESNIRILIEISERAFHSRVDSEMLIGELEKLRDMGFLIALDDFGVESSNIQRLQQFPIDVVKLDRSLIRELVDNERQRTTVFSIARMIENLGLTCIVEGVETEQQAQMLQEMGLVVHQGFFHARPMSPEAIVARQQDKGGQPDAVHGDASAPCGVSNPTPKAPRQGADPEPNSPTSPDKAAQTPPIVERPALD